MGSLVGERWTAADLDTLPYAVALPIRRAVDLCRREPPVEWTPQAYSFIGTCQLQCNDDVHFPTVFTLF